MDELQAALRQKRYRQVKDLLHSASDAELLEVWPAFSPFERLILFKLLEASRAVRFFVSLPFESQYFLLGGIPLGALGPVLDSLPRPEAEELFHQLGEAEQKKLLEPA